MILMPHAGFEGPWSRELAGDWWWFEDYAKKYLPNCTCKVLLRRDSRTGITLLCRGEEKPTLIQKKEPA